MDFKNNKILQVKQDHLDNRLIFHLLKNSKYIQIKLKLF